jgi:two-component system, cell cycle response regulator
MLHRGWIRRTRQASIAGLAVFALVTIAVPHDSWGSTLANTWLYNALVLLACVVAGSRAVLVARDRAAWVAFTAALAAWAFGEIWTSVAEPETFPSLADAGFLAFYPLLYAGIVLLLHVRVRTLAGTLWLDGLTAALAAAALGAAVLFEVVRDATEGPIGAVATNLAYPLGDLLLLSALVGVLSITGWRLDRRLLLVGLGVLSMMLVDSIYLFQTASGTYAEGTWIDVLWPAAMLLIASAAWVRESPGPPLEVAGRPLLAVPAACALTALAVLVYDHFQRLNLLTLVLAAATLLAVVVRLALTFRENSRLFELTRHEAVTDSLTGLGNRRRLVADLVGYFESSREPALLLLFDLDGFKGYNDAFGHPAGDALLARLGEKLTAAPGTRGAAYRMGGDEFCLIATLEGADAEQLMQAASDSLVERGEGFEVTSSLGAVLLPDEASDPVQALQLADERLYASKHSGRVEGDRTMRTLLTALSLREPEAREHLEDVGALAVQMGTMLGLRDGALPELSRAAQLHDIGKLAVPDEILSKPGPLDEREWAFVREHPLVGERILRASPALRDVASIVRSTHERWDGTGYPDGLAGEEIPLAARIIFACDAYDAMTSGRPYRAPLAPGEALAELERCAGSQFDPTVVRVLTALVRDELGADRAA